MQAQEMMNLQQAQIQDASEIAGIDNQANSMMAQALQQAQETSYGNDTNKTDVSNKFAGK